MTQEEKAKAYDEALKVLHKYDGVHIMFTQDLKEEMFPELKESEDERIRKELLEHCKNQAKPYIRTGNKCPQIQSWIAWLEKQSKENMIEALRLEYERGKSDVLQEQRKEWTSEDLLNRNEIMDILQEYNRDDLIAWLEKQGDQKPVEKPEWYDSMDEFYADALIEMIENSDLMDRDKRNRLVWIEKHRVNPVEWSEEDDKMLQTLVSGVDCYTYFNGIQSEDVVNWLKSLKQKFKEE